MLPKLNETSETEMVDPDPTERPLNKIHVSQSFSSFLSDHVRTSMDSRGHVNLDIDLLMRVRRSIPN